MKGKSRGVCVCRRIVALVFYLMPIADLSTYVQGSEVKADDAVKNGFYAVLVTNTNALVT
jgi:hypothetical protein